MGSSKAVDAFKKPKSMTLRSMAQILRLPYVQQEENIPGPLGHVQATGFGSILFGSTATMGCIPVRRIQENECTDIISKNDKDIYRVAAKKAVPYSSNNVISAAGRNGLALVSPTSLIGLQHLDVHSTKGLLEFIFLELTFPSHLF
ncbi:uncharacterized protein LOC136026914 [Artemia franciscana]|uniref:uncharacterized protein LOC136026914 n=1 Tax=Artemia franciscana TaxID=6661 RepID=UPI0032DBB393